MIHHKKQIKVLSYLPVFLISPALLAFFKRISCEEMRGCDSLSSNIFVSFEVYNYYYCLRYMQLQVVNYYYCCCWISWIMDKGNTPNKESTTTIIKYHSYSFLFWKAQKRKESLARWKWWKWKLKKENGNGKRKVGQYGAVWNTIDIIFLLRLKYIQGTYSMYKCCCVV